MNKIEMLNIAQEFVPVDANISKIKKENGESLYRNSVESLKNNGLIIIEYNYKTKKYTMVLIDKDGQWQIKDMFDDIKEEINYKEEEKSFNKLRFIEEELF